MPRISPTIRKRAKSLTQYRYRKRLKVRKLSYGCNKDIHDERPIDVSDTDDVNCSKTRSKTWPGGSTPKFHVEEGINHKNTLPKPTKLKFKSESVSEGDTDDISGHKMTASDDVVNDVFDNEVTESESESEPESGILTLLI